MQLLDFCQVPLRLLLLLLYFFEVLLLLLLLLHFPDVLVSELLQVDVTLELVGQRIALVEAPSLLVVVNLNSTLVLASDLLNYNLSFLFFLLHLL